MRVGFLTSDLNTNHGWGQYSVRLLRALRKQGAELIAVTAENSPTLDGLVSYPLLPAVVPFAPRLTLRLIASYPRLRALLADCDLIHSTVEWYAPLALAVAAHRPTFVTIHGSYASLPAIRPFPLNLAYRHAYRRADLLCVSHYTASVVQQIVPDARTRVIPNGADIERFAALPVLADRPADPVILTSGGVKVRKGTLQLVRALAVVRQQLPDVRCVVIGTLSAEPAYVEQVRAEIERLDLRDHVELLGFVDQQTLDHWYGRARLFVLPSINAGWKFEGFGLVHLEASAAGLPVIGTTGCGVADAVSDGVTGLLVSQERMEEELPRAILSILNDPHKAQAMGAAGREKASQQTWDLTASQVLAAYQSALTAINR